MKRILVDLCFITDVTSALNGKKVAFDSLYEVAEGLSFRAQKDQQITYGFMFNLLNAKSHKLIGISLLTIDGFNEESLINTARALKALNIEPKRIIINNEEVEL